MTIRTYEPKIFFYVVRGIAIDVIDVKRDRLSHPLLAIAILAKMSTASYQNLFAGFISLAKRQ